ncbi:hypothetical protein NDU88_007438 [Pleurodeles waltl]|uniref:Uncharacterized protein n=1 Tax=Pleurodeles waltl TaxID=8319 RepID=A0AAV7RRT5_PLEWA|nr:hypothetical protein NDU88_007438 [Pleurodeles waltl]
MPVHDCILTRELSRTETLGPGVETCGQDGGYWRRAALEVRKVRNLTSRVALRGDNGGSTGRDSTGEETACGRQKNLAPVIKSGGI